VYAGIREHVNLSMQEIFEVLAEANEVQERAPGVHLYEEIDVAIGTILPPSDGTEETNVTSAVHRRDSENLMTSLAYIHCMRSWQYAF
jgi:hypothetical protein